jgi:hypothetical protein
MTDMPEIDTTSYPPPDPPRRWAPLLARIAKIGVVVVVVLHLVLQALPHAHPGATRMQCSNNLKPIGLALQIYHDQYGSFPPANIVDKDGRPMHSWRVLILPNIEQQKLYEAYNFDEPWDGPNKSTFYLKQSTPTQSMPS